MANPYAGEVAIWLDGQRHVAKLTLGALAELEAALEAGSLMELVERFEARRFTTRDVLALIVAGLRGGGWQGSADDLRTVEIGGGPVEAARAAAELLARAFALPGEGWPGSTGPGSCGRGWGIWRCRRISSGGLARLNCA
ncbi:MAG: gene transfer agent family protein [Rhodobacteraceae bacterium]|nr:gene transfer agent family protein [Paracoccaceae bacterium]